MSDEYDSFQIITANLLESGSIVYMTLDGGQVGWNAAISGAHIFESEQSKEMVALAEADVAANLVISVYPIEIAGNREPLSARERIRAKGPSVAYGDDAVAANKSGYQI